MKQLWENKQAYALLVALQRGSMSSTLAIAIKMEDFVGPRSGGHLSYCTKTNGLCNSKSRALVSVFPGKTLQLLKITAQCYGGWESRPALPHRTPWAGGNSPHLCSATWEWAAGCRRPLSPWEVAGVTGNSVFLFHPISLPWLVTTVWTARI